MKRTLAIILSLFSLYIFFSCKSGLVTMSNSCGNSINQGEAANIAGNYSNALDIFNQVLQKCDAYDAKEKAYAGKAASLNGLKQYNDALTAANEGMKINSNSIAILFQKASAEFGLGMANEAKADFTKIIEISQKNQNTAERATIYAKIAEIEMNQKMYDDAITNVNQAIAIDNSNLNFYMQLADINAAAGKYNEALKSYDDIIAKGKNDAEVWKAKTVTATKIYQQKYNTDNADQLAKKMTASEKQSLCSDIQQMKSKGGKDMNIDLLQLALCK